MGFQQSWGPDDFIREEREREEVKRKPHRSSSLRSPDLPGIAKSIFGFAALAFVFSLPWCLSTAPFSSEITVFPIVSDGNGLHFAGYRMIFTAFPERQEVVCTELSPKPCLSKFTNCTVRDKSNWVCEEFGVTYSMTDGNYTKTPPKPFTTYSNGWKWWFFKAVGPVKGNSERKYGDKSAVPTPVPRVQPSPSAPVPEWERLVFFGFVIALGVVVIAFPIFRALSDLVRKDKKI